MIIVDGATDQFDGVFTEIAGRELREKDVILGPARWLTAVAADPETGGIVVDTTIGQEIIDADATVRVFRPNAPADAECPDCGAGPDEPCDPVTCMTYTALDDAAGLG
jgi:hypothetical protein